ncbi:MAG: oligosaccharide flippase family protein [Thermoplasmatota archaeon]
MLRRNILLNGATAAWTAVLTVAAIPWQVHFLGAEAYGLLAFLVSLQVVLSVLDLGLSTIANREVAIDPAALDLARRGLLASMGGLSIAIGLVTASALAVSAPWIATHLLGLAGAARLVAAEAIALFALGLALRWPVTYYHGLLAGAQRFRTLNLLKAVGIGVRILGGLVVLSFRPELTALLAWIAASSALDLAMAFMACRKALPEQAMRPRFSALPSRVRPLALQLTAAAALTVAITQSDRLALAHFRPLTEMGAYSVAYNLVIGVALVQGIVTTAIFPTFAADLAAGLRERVAQRYDAATRSVAFVLGLPTALMACFGAPILAALAGSVIARTATPVLAFLAVGFLVNGVLSITYTLAVAAGRASLPLKVNSVGVVFYLPALVLLVMWQGITGAGIAWMLLNAGYLFTLAPWVHRQVLDRGTVRWAWNNLGIFAVLGALTLGVPAFAAHWFALGRPATWALMVAGAGAYSVLGYARLHAQTRREVQATLGEAWRAVGGRPTRKTGAP